MREALLALLNNPAFWVFLGTFVTTYFGYKQVVKKTPAGIAKQRVKNISSFEELRAVVEVLQGELIKKDKRHKDDTDYILSQLREARSEVLELTHRLAEAMKQNSMCNDKISQLEKQLGLTKPTK